MEMFTVNFFDYFFVVTCKPIFQFYEIIESFSSFRWYFLLYTMLTMLKTISITLTTIWWTDKNQQQNKEKNTNNFIYSFCYWCFLYFNISNNVFFSFYSIISGKKYCQVHVTVFVSFPLFGKVSELFFDLPINWHIDFVYEIISISLMRKFNSIEIGSFWKVSHGTENDVNWITRISHKEIRLLRLPHSRLLSFQSCSSEFFDRPNVSPSVWINEIYSQDHTAERNIKFFVQVSMSSVLFAKKKFLMFERVFLCIHSSCDASLYVFFFSRYFKTDDVICCVFDCHVLCNDHIWIWLQSCVFFFCSNAIAGRWDFSMKIGNYKSTESQTNIEQNCIKDECLCSCVVFLQIYSWSLLLLLGCHISVSLYLCIWCANNLGQHLNLLIYR